MFPITTMRRTLPITFVILSVLLEPQAAYAYLDPGTGSMLLSVFVGLISGAYFVIRKLPSTLRSLFFRLTGKTDALKHNTLTFYAESAAYWSTFKPILAGLETLGVESSYLTSDEKDPVFTSGFKCVHPRYIGKSNTAYTALGFLQTKVFVLTTPASTSCRSDVLRASVAMCMWCMPWVTFTPTSFSVLTTTTPFIAPAPDRLRVFVRLSRCVELAPKS